MESGPVTEQTGIKNLSKGAVIDVTNGEVSAELSLVVRYGYSIPKEIVISEKRE